MQTVNYLQKNPLSMKNIILWLTGLFILLGSLGSLLYYKSLLLSISLLIIGLLPIIICYNSLRQSERQLLKFIEETSVFIHNHQAPLALTEIISILQAEGFTIQKYPYENYYCVRKLQEKFLLHFFISNNDTPDCQKAEAFSILFIKKIAETGSSLGQQFFIAFEYGAHIQEKAPEFIALCKQGFITTKEQGSFGYRIAYDSQTATLYYAEAIANVVWNKKEIINQYMSKLLQKLFDANSSGSAR